LHMILLILLSVLLCVWEGVSGKCGYDACPATDPHKLNIHLIAHSHNDVGWTQTPDQLYDNHIVKILGTVVEELQKDPARKYTQVEMYFFHRWWLSQTDELRDVVRKLVAEGRLVFINGGWTVNDEGAAHYNNIIDQMTMGLKFLNQTFGTCGRPKVSWQIDPFGASIEMPSLYGLMGFDANVYNRGVPKGEYIWHTSKDLNTKVFTTVLHDHYYPPGGFNFENANESITDANVKERTSRVVTMDGDFFYNVASKWYDNMDKLLKETKASHPDVNMIYSSPNCYIKALNGMNLSYTERDVDYLSYWVGYYSNRPALKYQDRQTNNILQASKQLSVIGRLDPAKTKVYLDEAANEVAILTHHDAITGTCPQTISNEYTSRLQSGYAASKAVIRKAFEYLKSKTGDKKVVLKDVFCDALNITDCSLTETNDRIAVTVYNPIARPVEHYIRVPVVDAKYEVFDEKGQAVKSVAILPVSDDVRKLPERNGSLGTHELVFSGQLPALGFTTYFVEKQKAVQDTHTSENNQQVQAPIDMKGKSFTLHINETTGAIETITVNGTTHKLRQSFKWYKSRANQPGLEDSGSYNFCPDGNANDYGTQKLVARHTSGGVHELSQVFANYIHQTVRTYEDRDYVEFDWTVGGIPTDDKIGKEIITRFESDLKSDGVYYTDANGRQTIRRKFNPQAKICGNNVIAANWFPIYSHVTVKDEKQGLALTVLNDRTQGGSSLMDGSVELMVHRRLEFHGAGSTLVINETGIDGKGLEVRGKHYLFLHPIAQSPRLVRRLSEQLFMGPIETFATYKTREEYSGEYSTSFSGVGDQLPESVRLLTLEKWSDREVLVRFEHMYEKADN
ncbi:unnamed protein product, partial [Oppiella nova]